MILQKENKILRSRAEELAEVKSPRIRTLIKKMAEAMFKEPDGIGIAAPQIGEALRIFLVAKEAVVMEADELRKRSREKTPGVSGAPDIDERDYLVFINPIIKKLSTKKSKDIEGCLSVRGIYGEVTRPEKLTVEYIDEIGKKHTRGASGLFARVIQHEVDHLNGVLFIDKAEDIRKLANA